MPACSKILDVNESPPSIEDQTLQFPVVENVRGLRKQLTAFDPDPNDKCAPDASQSFTYAYLY